MPTGTFIQLKPNRSLVRSAALSSPCHGGAHKYILKDFGNNYLNSVVYSLSVGKRHSFSHGNVPLCWIIFRNLMQCLLWRRRCSHWGHVSDSEEEDCSLSVTALALPGQPFGLLAARAEMIRHWLTSPWKHYRFQNVLGNLHTYTNGLEV